MNIKSKKEELTEFFQYVLWDDTSSQLWHMKKFNQNLLPSDLSIMNVLIIVRNRIKINSEETIFLFANTYTKNNKIKESFLCNSSETISIIYNKYKDDDNMLYLTYCKENVFG